MLIANSLNAISMQCLQSLHNQCTFVNSYGLITNILRYISLFSTHFSSYENGKALDR